MAAHYCCFRFFNEFFSQAAFPEIKQLATIQNYTHVIHSLSYPKKEITTTISYVSYDHDEKHILNIEAIQPDFLLDNKLPSSISLLLFPCQFPVCICSGYFRNKK
mmetsp:Transcript_21181/g.31824  ORF Transcript_21181/g.31824 Transcript_21181/m.31824 type:complete len:105 (-) Transcript_21181:303-617(-)